MNLEEYAEFLVKSICKEPEMVRVQSFQEDEMTHIEIMVPESEMGAVIGKAGKIASSLRILIQAYAYLQKIVKVKVYIVAF